VLNLFRNDTPIQAAARDTQGQEQANHSTLSHIPQNSYSPMIVFASPFRPNNQAQVWRSLLTSSLIEGEGMKTRNTITKLITITMAVAALAAAALLCAAGGLQPVEAQSGDGSVRFTSYASIGIVYGQRVRLSVGNTEVSAGSLTLSFSYYLAHGSNSSSSVPFYESEWIRVRPGEFRFSDLSREDVNIEGEPETGRAQVIARVTVIAPAGSNPANFPGSLEVINEATGATTVLTSNRIWDYTPCCDPR
jgi:hypothetical protein